MLLEVLFGGADELQGNELISTLLETGDDVTDEPALDAVGLDGNEAVWTHTSASIFTAKTPLSSEFLRLFGRHRVLSVFLLFSLMSIHLSQKPNGFRVQFLVDGRIGRWCRGRLRILLCFVHVGLLSFGCPQLARDSPGPAALASAPGEQG